MKAGLNKVILEQIVADESKSKISIPDHLKEVKYRVIAIGARRTTLDNFPEFLNKSTVVYVAPNSGFKIKENGKEYVVCGVEDILAASSEE